MQEALLRGHGFTVSDGSYKDEAGAMAWIIKKGSNLSMPLVGKRHTPGQPSDHSLFCSELAGIVGALYTLPFWPPTSTNPPLKNKKYKYKKT